MNCLDIDSTSPDFKEKLIEVYGKSVVIGKRNTRDIIKYCEKNYVLHKTDKSRLDVIGKSNLEAFASNCNISDKNKIAIYKVEKSSGACLFYKHYYNCHRDYLKYVDADLNIYIFCDEAKDVLSCTDSLMDIRLSILRGVSEEDIADKTNNYISHLNYLYLYDWNMQLSNDKKQGD